MTCEFEVTCNWITSMSSFMKVDQVAQRDREGAQTLSECWSHNPTSFLHGPIFFRALVWPSYVRSCSTPSPLGELWIPHAIRGYSFCPSCAHRFSHSSDIALMPLTFSILGFPAVLPLALCVNRTVKFPSIEASCHLSVLKFRLNRAGWRSGNVLDSYSAGGRLESRSGNQ
jgi:hypothetical protein